MSRKVFTCFIVISLFLNKAASYGQEIQVSRDTVKVSVQEGNTSPHNERSITPKPLDIRKAVDLYTLRLKTYYSMDYVSMWDGYSYKYSYKVYLYKLSRELYLYLKSMNDVKNNDLGHKGLAPIRSHYSNVENGIGVVGGCRVMETEWICNVSTDIN